MLPFLQGWTLFAEEGASTFLGSAAALGALKAACPSLRSLRSLRAEPHAGAL